MSTYKILVCDDDPGILEVMKIILEESAYEVKTVSTGKGIQKVIKDYQPDLMFLDLWMPKIDGREITKILKKDPQTKNVPIIIVSALNDTEQIAKGIQADGFLPKPFNIADLLKIVESNIHKS